MVADFKAQLLRGEPLSRMTSEWVVDRIPHIFSGDRTAFNAWKEIVSSKLQIDGCAILIVGSAGTGFSLNPYKNFKVFGENSDVDLAVVSDYHFNICWRRLRSLGTERFKLTTQQKESYQDHINRLIYWGAIATDRLLPIFDFGTLWKQHISFFSQTAPINGKEVNVRIYKDFDSIRAYHVNNLKGIQKHLLDTTNSQNQKLQ